MRRPSMLVCVRAAVLALPVFLACASNSSNSGGSGGTGTGGNNGTGSGGNNGTGTGGNNGTGGSTGGGASGNNGSSSSTTVEVLTDGGVVEVLSDGGVVSLPPDASSGKRVCEVAGPDVIADFEDDTATNVASNGYTGIWYDFADTTAGADDPTLLIQATTDPMPRLADGGVCNKWSMHTTGGLGTSGTNGYAGTRGDFLAHLVPAGSTTANMYPPPYPIPSSFDGISFDVMVGAGGVSSSLTFEVVTQDTQPTFAGGSVPDSGAGSAQYNNRGWMLTTSATQTNATPISSSWQTVYIPFALLTPVFLVSGCSSGVLCQAPVFDPTQALGIQFVENPGESPGASFDLWIDNIAFYTGTQGLAPPTMPNNISPTFADGSLGSCTKPTGSTGKDLQWAYSNWYSRFVQQVNSGSNSELKIVRPEDNYDTVSEGIGYGMLIAVAMGDQTLFDGLWQYWQDNIAVGNSNGAPGGLMTWDIPGGSGSATDADQDAAFALLQAGVKFGNTSINYTSAGQAMVATIWDHEIDPNSFLPTGGSNYTTNGGPTGTPTTSGHVTDPSYFAPGYYPTFKANDTTSGHAWGTVQTNVYAALENIEKTSDGLVPAWCSSTSDTATSGFCTNPATNTSSTDTTFQYDAHRVAWRVGLDSCWNGTAAAQTVLSSIVNFFNGIAEPTASTGGGIGRIMDLYTITGVTTPTPASGAEPNSMSLIGCTGVGAMATGTSSFVNSAWQFVLDASNRGTLDVNTTGGNSGYSYFNATVGLLTLLSMSGNIMPP